MNELEIDEDLRIERLLGNPLLEGIIMALAQIDNLKKSARDYFFQVLLCQHPCPACGGRLWMSAPSRCTCECGLTLDPTVEFQPCPQCGGKLVLRYFHYACSSCDKTVASRFLFDENVFNNEYFQKKMAEARERKKQRLAEMRHWLATTRSAGLDLMGLPALESIPGLETALDEFVGAVADMAPADFLIFGTFHMADYRNHILSDLAECRLFSRITPLCPDPRRDRARRFTTLVFMQHDQEIDLIQHGNDLWVIRHEANT